MNQVTNTSSSEIRKCFDLLEEGEKIIRTDQKDAILVVGNTGSGKTTLVQFLAGDNNDLYAEEASPGSGDFIIIDRKDRVSSQSTVVSKTIFPELTIDTEYNVGIYDCPGFVDTRGAAIDIAGTYFIRKVINSIERVKIILAVNYTSVRKGIDRGDFLEMIRHVLSLVQNAEKYVNSFAIVVTKVDNTYIKNKKTQGLDLVSDDVIRGYVAKFLQTFKENVAQISGELFSARAIKLVDTLLTKNGTSYKRIGLFRRPNEEGALSQSNELQEGKRYLKNMIVNNIPYTRIYPDDFGYAISDRSKNEVRDLISEINKTIQVHIQEICAEVKTMVDVKHQKVTDILEFERFLIRVNEMVDLFKDSVEYETNFSSFVRKLLNLLVELRLSPSRKSFSDIQRQGKYLDFLELVSDHKTGGSSSVWKEGFHQFIDYLHKMREWYHFLNQLQNHLSSYEVQKFKSKFTYLLKTHSSLGSQEVKQFVQQSNFDMTSSLEALTLDTTQIVTLDNLIRSSLNTSISVEHDTELKGHTVSGSYIILSEIDKYFSHNDQIINIFASDKIFIDKNITMNDDLNNLVMISPTLEIIGTNKIVLDGKDGSPLPTAIDGENGSPGLPGNPGANFFGIALNYMHLEKLTISANGGQGGHGQNGGDGIPGEDGSSPLRNHGDGTCSISFLDWFSFEHKSGLLWRQYCSYGSPGGRGGDGGDGGVGGHGGLSGSITLVDLQGHKPLASVSSKDGSVGTAGLGGKAGAGGRAGKSVNTKSFMFWWKKIDCDETDRLAKKYGDCSVGDHLRNGPPGQNGEPGQVVLPDSINQPKPRKEDKSGAVIMKYKEFMRNYLILDNLNQNEKYQFLKSLDENSDLSKVFTVANLVSEFINLENIQSADFNWFFQYEQLLKLVESKQINSNIEEKQVLLSLQKAIISKLCLLKVKPQKTVITQIPQYLDSVQTTVSQFLKERSLISNDIHKELKQELSKSFQEIHNRVQPIANRISIMTDTVRSRIKIIVDQLLFEELRNQNEKRQLLEQNLVLLKFLHGIRGITQFLSTTSTLGVELININHSPNKFVIQNGNYEEAISKIRETLLRFLQEGRSDQPKQLGQILENAINQQEIPNNIKNSLNYLVEESNAQNLDKILKERKISRNLLEKLADMKPESLQMLQIIEVFLHVQDATILAIGDKTSSSRTSILAAILHTSTVYSNIQFYVDKLYSSIEQVVSDISSHLVDEIVDTSRIPKQKTFGDIKLLLQQLQKSIKLPEDLLAIHQQLLSDLNTISSAYDNLSYFQEFDRLLALARIKDTPTKVNTFKNMIDTLETITKANQVLDQYQSALKNMDQIVFPFGKLYTDKFSLQSDTSSNARNITSLALHKLQAMKLSIENHGLYLESDYEKMVFNSEFTEESQGPFYTWKNEEHKEAIRDLLAGKKVTLKADILGAPVDALKFSSIRIKFSCRNPAMQSELDSYLDNLLVTMIHGEDSYYRCGNEFYRFSFNQQSLGFSYRAKANGEPEIKNVLFDNIKNGVSVLSPYTQWSIQLEKGNFDALARFKDRVDIKLEGHGKWIRDGQLLCGKTLQKYYTIDETISVANAVDGEFMDLSELNSRPQMEPNTSTPQHHRVARSVVEQPSNIGQIDMNVITKPLLKNVNMEQIEMTNQQNRVSFCATAQSSLNSCLLLLDLLLRRFTNVKPKYIDHCSNDFFGKTKCAVEIVRDFEKIVETLCDYPHQYDIDPVPLIELVFKDMVHKNGRNVGEILIKSVQSNELSVPDEFYNQLRQKMTQ